MGGKMSLIEHRPDYLLGFCSVNARPSNANPVQPGQGPRDPKCPFLDLPGEIRNIIYKGLLDSRDSRTCFPQILATCKLINNEARALVKDVKVTILIDQGTIRAGAVRCGKPVFKRAVLDLKGIMWPYFLRRTERIRIELSPTPCADDHDDHSRKVITNSTQHTCFKEPMAVLNNVLYAICDFLVQGNVVKELEIDITAYENRHRLEHGCTCWPDTLYPLPMLGNLDTLILHGTDQQAADTLLNHVKATSRPDVGLFREYDEDIDDVKAGKRNCDLLANSATGVAPDHSKWKAVLESSWMNVEALLRPGRDTFMTAMWEQQFRHAGGRLQAVL